jgi:transposase
LDTNPTFGVFFMAKYDEKFKSALVQEYLSNGGGYRALSAKYGVGYGQIRRWVSSYRQNGDNGLIKKFSHYSAEFKLSVLQRMWREDLSFSQTVALFDLRGGSTVVSGWERKYHAGGITALAPKPRGRPKKMKSPELPKPSCEQPQESKTLQELQRENEYLRAEVAYLKKLDALVRAKQQAAQKKRKP